MPTVDLLCCFMLSDLLYMYTSHTTLFTDRAIYKTEVDKYTQKSL